MKPEDCKVNRSMDFEYKGWTVCIRLHRGGRYAYGSVEALIKIRPSLGDDFPTILRQMKAGREDHVDHHILLVEQYAGSGGTLDQVRKVFRNEGFLIVTVGEIEDCIEN